MSTTRVAWVAVVSRVALAFISCVANKLAADYDTSSELQIVACGQASLPSLALTTGSPSLPVKLVWDSVFFTRIAACGYEYEQYFAFFPLLPGLLKLGMKAVQGVGQAVPATDALALTATCLTLAAFVTSAVFLHKLSIDILRDKALADFATLLYIWNPASIFYSAAYTESIFACAAFTGLFHLGRQPWLATVFLCAASATRSNGILHGWYVLHRLASTVMQPGPLQKGTSFARLVIQAGLQCCVICLPVLTFQYYGWLSFCQKDMINRPWCSAKFPNVYSFVQSHYWGVGLFKYYKLQQVPNFALATPMLLLSCIGCWTYLKQDMHRALQLRLTSPKQVASATAKGAVHVDRSRAAKQSAIHEHINTGTGFYCKSVAPYIYHWAVMTACAMLVMNVQVATRFLSACPALYWYIASMVHTKKCKWIWGYFMMYWCLGSVLFPNFYPWT